MIDLRTPQFAIGQIAKASDVSAPAIRQWFDRGIITLGKTDREAPENGFARLLSGQKAIAIGIIGKLGAMGVPLELASRAAHQFAFTGVDGERQPAHLFPEGETIIAIKGDRFQLLNTNATTLLSDVLLASDTSVCLLDLYSTVQSVREKLNLGPDPMTPVDRLVPPARPKREKGSR